MATVKTFSGSKTQVDTSAASVTGKPVIYVIPPGAELVPGPLFFGLHGDSVDPSMVPQGYVNDFSGSNCKPNYKAKEYQPAFVKQVSENYAEVGAPNNFGLKSLGTAWDIFPGAERSLEPMNLDNGRVNYPMYNLLQPLPYWNIKIVNAQQLASYESGNKVLVTQVPAEYTPAGVPNLYLGK